MGSIPGSGRSSGGGNGNLLQYSCLGNPMHRGVWYVIVLMVAHDLIGNDLGTKQQQQRLHTHSKTWGESNIDCYNSEQA